MRLYRALVNLVLFILLSWFMGMFVFTIGYFISTHSDILQWLITPVLFGAPPAIFLYILISEKAKD